MSKQRMICLQHASRRRGQLGDDGGITIMSSHYRLNEQGRVFVLPEHAAIALQGSKWTEVSEAELDVTEQGSAADVESRLRREIDELRSENAVLRAQLASTPPPAQPSTAPAPVSAPAPAMGTQVNTEKPAAPVPSDDKNVDDLSSKTRDELAQMAKDLKIDVPASASKVKLLSELRAAMGG